MLQRLVRRPSRISDSRLLVSSPVIAQRRLDHRVYKLPMGIGQPQQQELAHGFALGSRQCAKARCRSLRHINQMEQDFRLQGAFEVGDQIRRQMKSHPVGIEKAQAVAIPVEVCDGNRGPVVLLILRTIRRQRTLVGIIIETPPLAKADAPKAPEKSP